MKTVKHLLPTCCYFSTALSFSPLVALTFGDVRRDSATPIGLSAQLASADDQANPLLSLPLKVPWTPQVESSLEAALLETVDSTEFFLMDAESSYKGKDWQWSCSVPKFGALSRVKLVLKNDSLVLSFNENADDFGWICLKLYECRELLEAAGVDCYEALRGVVAQHFNQLPADPGIDAETTSWNEKQQRRFEEFLGDDAIEHVLARLDREGFVVNDGDSLKTKTAAQDKLSSYLSHTTGQGDTVRTDRVHFLTKAQATTCGIQEEYDILMGLAAYFNSEQDQKVPVSEYEQPIAPAVLDKQLTVPRLLQFAEYGENDFYTVSIFLSSR